MADSVAAQVVSLRKMSTVQLQERWREAFGHDPGSRTKKELWQALAREIQYQIHGCQPEARPVRDLRLPMPGTVITRLYKGYEIAVKVLADGFEYRGQVYRSLTAIADEVTGSHWSGYRFFGLPQRKRQQR